jgi:hypothetical protein
VVNVSSVEEVRAISGQQTKDEREPFRVRLPGFVREEDIGLGDAIKQVSRAFGIRPCDGCDRRAATLNRWFAFNGRRR